MKGASGLHGCEEREVSASELPEGAYEALGKLTNRKHLCFPLRQLAIPGEDEKLNIWLLLGDDHRAAEGKYGGIYR